MSHDEAGTNGYQLGDDGEPGGGESPPPPSGRTLVLRIRVPAVPTGFGGGLLAGLGVALLVGLVIWMAGGSGGGTPVAKAGHQVTTGIYSPPSQPLDTAGVPSLPAATDAPSDAPTDGSTDNGGNPKGGATGAGGIPLPVYTPSGPQPALQPAAALPFVTAADPTVACPTATVQVGNAKDLTAAMAAAAPGTVIQMADGTYSGNFTGIAKGTAAQPIFLCGGPGAVLDGGTTKTKGGYVLHLDNGLYWRLVGFTVQNGQKGVVLDHTDYSIVQGLTVQQIGDEGIHLREFSDDDLVLNNTVHDTGLLSTKFGEGIYIGTATSNWCTYTACQPDNSNNDVIRGNTVSKTTAENVDIKEGTTGGALIGNHFDGAGFAKNGASGWVNAKGNNYLIKGNDGANSYQDGFQTHQILAGWGQDNVFEANTGSVNGSGYAFHFTPVNGNVWTCDNTVQGAAQGAGNIPCAAAP